MKRFLLSGLGALCAWGCSNEPATPIEPGPLPPVPTTISIPMRLSAGTASRTDRESRAQFASTDVFGNLLWQASDSLYITYPQSVVAGEWSSFKLLDPASGANQNSSTFEGDLKIGSADLNTEQTLYAYYPVNQNSHFQTANADLRELVFTLPANQSETSYVTSQLCLAKASARIEPPTDPSGVATIPIDFNPVLSYLRIQAYLSPQSVEWITGAAQVGGNKLYLERLVLLVENTSPNIAGQYTVNMLNIGSGQSPVNTSQATNNMINIDLRLDANGQPTRPGVEITTKTNASDTYNFYTTILPVDMAGKRLIFNGLVSLWSGDGSEQLQTYPFTRIEMGGTSFQSGMGYRVPLQITVDTESPVDLNAKFLVRAGSRYYDLDKLMSYDSATGTASVEPGFDEAVDYWSQTYDLTILTNQPDAVFDQAYLVMVDALVRAVYENEPRNPINVNLSDISFPDETGQMTTLTNNPGYRSIILPNDLTKLNTQGFMGCSNLLEVTLPSSLETLGANVFENCTSLAEIVIPNSVTDVGTQCFEGCTGLKSVVLSSGMQRLGRRAFYGCSSLETITLPAGLQAIERRTFNGCSKLQSLTILRTDAVVPFMDWNSTTKEYIPLAESTEYVFSGAGTEVGAGVQKVIYVPASLLDAYRSDADWTTALAGTGFTFAAIPAGR